MPKFDAADEAVWREIRKQIAADGPHAALSGARLQVAMTAARPGAGCARFGKVGVMTDWERYLTGDGDQDNGDEVKIVVNSTTWQTLNPAGRTGCIDHLLTHIFRDEEKGGFGILQHDVQDFTAVLERNGAWDEAVIAQLRRIQQITLPEYGIQQTLAPEEPAANGEAVDAPEAEAVVPTMRYLAPDGETYQLGPGMTCTECRDGILQPRAKGARGLRCSRCGSVFQSLTDATGGVAGTEEVAESGAEEDAEPAAV